MTPAFMMTPVPRRQSSCSVNASGNSGCSASAAHGPQFALNQLGVKARSLQHTVKGGQLLLIKWPVRCAHPPLDYLAYQYSLVRLGEGLLDSGLDMLVGHSAHPKFPHDAVAALPPQFCVCASEVERIARIVEILLLPDPCHHVTR